jgi:hypothetical protein
MDYPPLGEYHGFTSWRPLDDEDDNKSVVKELRLRNLNNRRRHIIKSCLTLYYLIYAC